ncbi:phosphoesterase [Desulfobacter hydrogenophilus]|uniref:Phosphoesterase n=1 Tax=Desulfobacter hydrogenophilus TaxID=2291 RepID=A0A328FJ76_9BACT|nr:metallophosphoesterase [Desulfobacter hydrogenophilus]NDY70668.1 phosphoesterase [Desulfobacter hydrogenophilus]QBH14031.1 phosphoesterase [Desulfobacter hydrogenophilus]RAM03552.1 phosphoesterase [Desulfobacter hydrogenophilus]
MRIYAVADIHGKPEHMESIYRILDQYQPELMIVPGDMTHFFNWSTVLSQLDSLPVPILAVRGNTDLKRIESRIKKAVNITLLTQTPLQVKGFSFVGTSGTLPLPFTNRICLNEKDRLAALPCPMEPDTVLVVHTPPKGGCDRVGKKVHAGSRNLARFIKAASPSLVLCGHIHEDFGLKTLHKSIVVNCAIAGPGSGAIIDLEKNEAPKVNLLYPDTPQS